MDTADGTTYEVRKRRWPSSFPRLQRPWELLRNGKPVGFYKTEQEALSTREATITATQKRSRDGRPTYRREP